MRQALIVENPKWERYSDASDKFKALKPEAKAVLVERGRVKEKNGRRGVIVLVKQQPDSPEALAVDLRKIGKGPDEIEKAVKAFKVKAGKAVQNP